MSLIETPWADVEAEIGDDLALRLSEELGGTRLYVPRVVGEHHPLAVAVGLDAAAKLVARMAGEAVLIPLAMGKRALILKLDAEGKSVDQIVRTLFCSRRHVFKVLADAKAGPSDQLDLF